MFYQTKGQLSHKKSQQHFNYNICGFRMTQDILYIMMFTSPRHTQENLNFFE